MVINKHWKYALWIIAIWTVVFIIGTSIWTLNKKDESGITEDKLQESSTETPIVETPVLYDYIEIENGCGPSIDETCVQMRTKPATTSPTVAPLRKGVVLRVSEIIENENGTWYKVTFDEWLRYPYRLPKDLYVSGENVQLFKYEGREELNSASSTVKTEKKILVDRSDQKLYAYEGEVLFMEESVSTGLNITPTPRGTFRIFMKTPSRYMQGPLPGISAKYYDLPGVPWNLFFTEQGGAIHGTYWHDHFGQQWSSGCVNVSLDNAKKLYEWADLGTEVIVQD